MDVKKIDTFIFLYNEEQFGNVVDLVFTISLGNSHITTQLYIGGFLMGINGF